MKCVHADAFGLCGSLIGGRFRLQERSCLSVLIALYLTLFMEFQRFLRLIAPFFQFRYFRCGFFRGFQNSETFVFSRFERGQRFQMLPEDLPCGIQLSVCVFDCVIIPQQRSSMACEIQLFLIDLHFTGLCIELFSLLFDSGHLAYCGEDYMAVLKKYAKRIKHVHLKDIRPEVIEKVKAEHLSFLQGVRLGTFTVPGDGAIDFGPIFDVLAENDYEGYVLVEAEQDPAIANPLEYAIKARKYIREKAGL